MSARKYIHNEENLTNKCLSSYLEIVIDEQSDSNSMDDDFNSETSNYLNTSITNDGHVTNQRQKKTPRPHRLIEKRRRDRMNRSLDVLLELIPHKKPENQKRVEKTEIIEMAIKYIRNLVSSTRKSSEQSNIEKQSTLNAYRSGYHNSCCDIYEYLEKYSNNDRFLGDFIRFINRKEIQLKDLTILPDRIAHIKPKKQSPHRSCDILNSNGNICSTSDRDTIENHLSINEQRKSIEAPKVPIFVLHPSGTHYIPMCIDSSIVSRAFNNQSNISRSSSITEQPQCHPVSIPVNFNPVPAISDPYELEIQNINVIGTRHQTSVRPN
ncbi:unnamed protein product [Adineta steineri]|uniref:BHLH domain-containing protein n=1 Tax=Adineta steineri TaxID=433720 RepID=A0A814SQ88_9BILA|nr:unnamed protein product [Adineta steineri]CAF1148997.1 unnamed protein product [Adineta steineri]CAF1324601.1 unnamed protein product [Adineta steineri]CAF3578770.1 unnamed protein product [Adineta steineri]